MATVKAAHKYWRILVTGVTFCNIAELEMRATAGGVNQCTGGTPSASTEYNTTNTATKAFDGNTATYWESKAGTEHWLKYTFASPVEVDTYLIRCGAYANEGPVHWEFQYSDNDSTWTTVAIERDVAGWTAQEIRTYQVDYGDATGKRFWRLSFTESNSATYINISEIKLRSATGGASIATGGRVATKSGWNGSQLGTYAFDGNDSTYWEVGLASTTAPYWIRYRLASEADVIEYVVRNGPFNEAPKAWTLEHSGNGLEWTVKHTATAQTGWAANESRTYLAPTANTAVKRPQIFICT